METDPFRTPGFTIGALALASGTHLADAVGLATVLGGIAGSHNEIDISASHLVRQTALRPAAPSVTKQHDEYTTRNPTH